VEKVNFGSSLQMKNVSKSYPGTLAVDDVDFEVNAGEIHALVGENGAGKSTLMKMLAGSFNDYKGQIFINGKEVKLHSPAIAKANGIEMIYQELSLAKPLSIAENILVSRLPLKNGFMLDKKAIIRQTLACLKSVEIDYLDPMTSIVEISQHEAQLVEIAKALGNSPCILAMDEPTSALSIEETERLFKIIKKLKNQGLAIIYISHHLPEIFKIADRVTVMRDGRKIATKEIADVTIEKLIELMLGTAVEQTHIKNESILGKEMLKVKNLTRYGFFHDISFYVRSREILGIGGLTGAGRTELCRSLCGADIVNEGEMFLEGKKIKLRNLSEALQYGIAYLTEDRKNEGLALRLTVGENILACLTPKYYKNFLYHKQNGGEVVKKLIKDLRIQPPDSSANTLKLSGGNQQKVLLAKWLATEPRILILDEPTRGVDVGAKITIHRAIEQLASQGVAVVLVSSDLPELVKLSDRILIMRNGRFIGEMPGKVCTEESVLMAMNGLGGYVHAN